MKKIRILYLTYSLKGNSETFIQNTIKQILNLENVALNIFTFESGENWLFKSQFYLKIFAILNKIRFDLIKFLFLDKLINFEYDIVYIDFGPNAFEFNDYFVARKKRMIVHLHGYDISKSLKSKKYVEWIIKFSKYNNIIVPAQYSSNRLEIIGCNKKNISVIPYAFYSDLLIKQNISEKYDLIFVGRFVAKKDPRILIYMLREVVKVFPDVKLCMIGNGCLFGEVVSLIEQYNLNKNVHLKGVLKQSEVYELLIHSKVYVQHSVTAIDGDQEGFPNSILEASSLGLPVVSTLHAGIPEIVIDGKSGFLVQEFNYTEMANKIIELLSDEALRERMGALGKEYILDKCDPYKRISAIERILI